MPRGVAASSDSDTRLADFVLELSAGALTSRSAAKAACSRGQVKLNSVIVRSGGWRLAKGDAVELLVESPPPPPLPDAAAGQEGRDGRGDEIGEGGVRIVYREGALAVAWKPAGLKLRGDPPSPGHFASDGNGTTRARDLVVEVQRRTGQPFAVAPGHALPKAAAGLVLLHLALKPQAAVLWGGQDEDEDVEGAAAASDGCRWCRRGRCLVTLAVLCGEVPRRTFVPTIESRPRALLLRRVALTPSNRHGAISTVELHAPGVPSQAWLQTAVERAGWPVANDPRLGRRASVSRVRGMLLARTRLSLASLSLPNLVEGEPRQFEAVRQAEGRFFEARLLQQQQRQEKPMEEELRGVPFDGHLYLAPSGVVMRPRDASELLVKTAFEAAVALRGAPRDDGQGPPPTLRVLDLGTGSGCLLLALLRRLWATGITAFGVGVDVDRQALAVASANARRALSCLPAAIASTTNGAGVAFCVGTFAEFPVNAIPVAVHGVDPGAEDAVISEGSFDVVIANPPYLDEGRAAIDRDVRLRDPHHALFAGDSGMRFYREIAANWSLSGSRVVCLEIAGNTATKVRAAMVTDADAGQGHTKGGQRWWPSLPAEIILDKGGMERVLLFRQIGNTSIDVTPALTRR